MCPVPLWVWGVFCVWVIVAALALTRSTDIIGWGLRFINILSAGILRPVLLQRTILY